MNRLEESLFKENQSNDANTQNFDKSSRSAGRWTKEEHQKFIEGLRLFGKNWKQVEDYVGTRNGAQIRSHAQKFFNRLEREYQVKFDGNKKEGGKKKQKASIRKVSECSESTTCTNRELAKESVEEPQLDEVSLPEKSEPESTNNPPSEVQSMPSASPQINPFEITKEPKKTPRKLSADNCGLGSMSYSLFDLLMAQLSVYNQMSNPPRLSDLVEMRSSSTPISTTLSVNSLVSGSFKPTRKMSDENLTVKDKLNLLRKPDYTEFEVMGKKIKAGSEDEY